MKSADDDKTVDLVGLPGVRRQRGRPATGNALTAAERQRLRRERLAEEGKGTLTVRVSADVLEALDGFLRFKDETRDSLVDRILRDRLLRKR
jgi:hypothetical protein